MAVYYKQSFNKNRNYFTVVEVLAWVKDDVLLEDVKTGLRYVLTSDEFLQHHEPLCYKGDKNVYDGIDLNRLFT